MFFQLHANVINISYL